MHPVFLISLYVMVCLLPLGIAWSTGWSSRPFWDELATGFGMLAFAIILIEFVLSGRFRTVSRKIGMDVTMRFHQLIARTALVLVLLHPFLYQSAFKPPLPWDPTRQQTLAFGIENLGSGIVAWLLIPVFIAIAIGRKQIRYRYETWRMMHGVAALVIVVLLLHHTMAAGRYAQDPMVAGVWLTLFAIAVSSLIYIYLVKPLWLRANAWGVRSVRPIGLKTWELILDPKDHSGLTFKAGQFAWIKVGRGAFSLRDNPFSIASAPGGGPELRFVIKELGDFTNSIGEILPGTTAYIDGPHGNLVISDRAEPAIALIAGGVGVAPLLSILRQLHLDRDPRPTWLVYGNRTAEQIVCKDELDAYEHQHGTQLVYVLSEPPNGWPGHVGLIDEALITQLFSAPNIEEWLFVLCGPPAMMETVERTLIELGVPASQILSERFDYD